MELDVFVHRLRTDAEFELLHLHLMVLLHVGHLCACDIKIKSFIYEN